MDEPRFDIVAPYSDRYQRHSEGAIAVLPDGQWLMGWTAFYGGFHDPSPAHILAMRSDDKGSTWSEPVLLLENDGKCNVMNVCFAQPGDGSIVMSHVRTDDETCYYSWPFSRKSTDGGRTWTQHEPMVDMDTWRGFPANDRMIVLSSGRLITPMALNPIRPADRVGWTDADRSLLQPVRSDDMGLTWQLCSNDASLEDTNAPRASEPAMFEKKDGTLVFYNRTKWGTFWAQESNDGGETLSKSYDTGIQSPAAPCIVGRIPGTGDLLMVWNNAKPDKPGSGGPRMPLTTAISRDDGETWTNAKDLEPDTSRSYMYPALNFDGDTAMILYSQGEADSVSEWSTNWHNTSLKLALVPVDWFYE